MNDIEKEKTKKKETNLTISTTRINDFINRCMKKCEKKTKSKIGMDDKCGEQYENNANCFINDIITNQHRFILQKKTFIFD